MVAGGASVKLFSSIQTRFDEEKTAASAAVLLREAGGQMEYMRLLKLLYMADRLSWKRLRRPITGDSYVAMDQGPVLSETYSLLKEEGEVEEAEGGPWSRTVERSGRYDVRLRMEPNLDPLSDAEIEMLRQVYQEFGRMDLWELVRRLHQLLPEWTNPKGSSIQIWPEQILKALGMPDEEVEAAGAEAKERTHFERLLGIG